MRYLITISYDGSNYYGFQRLNGKRTIQNEIEQALSKINKKAVQIKGAGRTDALVHAYGQRASFDLDYNIPPERLKNAINSLVPSDIYIKDCKIVDANFHARFNVKEKTYQYKINNGEYDPLKNNYYLHIPTKINLNKLRESAKLFIGVNNFKNFVSGYRLNYVAIIYKISVLKQDNIITITFVGKSFYRYMVRNLVGAMLDYANDKVTLDTIKLMLTDEKMVKTLSCAPAKALYLVNIKY